MPSIDVPYGQLNYEIRGNASDLLVFCHELGGSLRSWDRVVALLPAEQRVLRWDQRGAGLSSNVVAPFSFDEHADDFASILVALGIEEKVILVGIAAGAAIAIAFARIYPERIAGLILCAPALGVDISRRRYLLERSHKAATDGMQAVAELSLDQSYPEEIRVDAAEFQSYRAGFLANDPVSYGFANAALADFELGDFLETRSLPMAFIAGSKDRLRPPAYVENLARQVPGATYTVLQSGHIIPVQAPDELARSIRNFQRRCSAPHMNHA